MSTTEAKTIGHPDRFAYNEDGTVDWQTSASPEPVKDFETLTIAIY